MKTELAQALQDFTRKKPWRKAGPGGIILFALEGAQEGTVYVVVTGRENGYTLAMCLNAQALSDYAMLLNARQRNADEMEIISLQLQQDFLEFRVSAPDERRMNQWLEVFGVKNAGWPEELACLRRHRPACLPRMIDEEEEEPLTIALNAAVDWVEAGNDEKEQGLVSVEQIARTSRMPCAKWTGNEFEWSMRDVSDHMLVEIPSIGLNDELALRRLRRTPLSGAEFRCGIRMLPMPMDEEAESVPIFMPMLDSVNGMIAAPVVASLKGDAHMLAGEFLGYVEECGRPARILAADVRSYCLLGALAGQLGIPIEMTEDQSEMNDAMRSFLSHMRDSVRKAEKQEQKKGQKKEQRKPGRGICLHCEKEYAGSGMTRHLKECGAKHREAGDAEYFLIRASGEFEPDFWIYMEVKKDASLRQVDDFLRETWVECCGHMSAFRIDGEEYLSYCEYAGERGMNAKLQSVLENGQKFSYDYDFGSTTSLKLQVVDEYTAKNRRKKATLAARNIMPQYPCVRCGRPAELAYRPGGEPIAESVYCADCAQAEEYAEYMLPLLNSPRTGVCGYGGWSGDDEDDE